MSLLTSKNQLKNLKHKNSDMKNNFDLRKFLIENKITTNAQLSESNLELDEEMAPTGIGITGDQLDDLIKLGAIAGVEVYVRDKDGKNVRKVEYTLTNTSFEKNPDDIDIPEQDLKSD